MLVAGAGPVGLLTAFVLARAGPIRKCVNSTSSLKDFEAHGFSRANFERLRRIDSDPELQREVLLMPERLRSRSCRYALSRGDR